MRVGRLFGFVVSFLLLIAFVRLILGAPYIGVSEILVRFSQFEFDVNPLIDLFGDIREVLEAYSAPDPNFVPAESAWEQVGYFFIALYDAVKALAEIIVFIGKTLFLLLSQVFLAVVHAVSFVLWIFGFTS